MSIVYLLALAAVFLILLAAMMEAVAAVSRKPVWQSAENTHFARLTLTPTLQVVETVEQRTQSLPFVGTERRQAEGGEAGESADVVAQALRKVG